MSYEIRIEHNPFTIETHFFARPSQDAEWQTPAVNSSLMQYANKRLQLWIENFFEEVDRNEFNGYGSFNVIFKGVKADYSDVKIAAEKAKEKGIEVNVKWEPATEVSERLEQIKGLMQEAKQHPIFKEKIEQSKEIQANFEAAFNRDFDVYVAATMSAGKSTFINAMLGCELLPNANQATTATIAQITDNDQMPHKEFIGERYNKDGELVEPQQQITLATLQEWNKLEDTKLIKLEGNIVGITEREDVRLVISDTPGPNNSQDRSHWETTQAYIQDSLRNPLILYVLNAQQLGINDDKSVLLMIADIMKKGGKQSKDRFIFVLNKMDAIDIEKETTVEEILEDACNTLRNYGIDDPLVYPVSALNAGLFRRRKENDNLSIKERNLLSGWENICSPEGDYPGIDFVEHMPLSSSAKQILASREVAPAEYRTGIPAIEAMIDEYIDKYNLPNRVNRAYDALKTAIKISSDEQALVTSLKLNKDELARVKEILGNLRNSEQLKADAKAKIDGLLVDSSSHSSSSSYSSANGSNILYSKEIISQIRDKEADIRTMMAKFGRDFTGEATVEEAKCRVASLEEDVRNKAMELLSYFPTLVEEAQEKAKSKLKQIFDDFNNSLFNGEDFSKLPLPVLESLKQTMSNLELSVGDDDTVSTRDVIGKVKYFSTFKFWTWGDDIYGDEYFVVDLNKFYKTKDDIIYQHLNGIVENAYNKIEEDTKTYLGQFKTFIDEEYTAAMNKITEELQVKMENEEKLDQQIKDAEQKLDQINKFKEKLEQVISL
ncbi:dynamin family protein [Ursidibacter arcticus]